VALVTVRGWLATDSPIPSYGGMRTPREILEELARRVRAGSLPLLAQHDDRTVLHPIIHRVELREKRPGVLGVWVEYEIGEQEQAQGAAFSIGFSLLLDAPGDESELPLVRIDADASHFGEAELRGFANEIQNYFAVATYRHYQFSAAAPAKVIIEFVKETLIALPPDVLANIIAPALSRWFVRKPPKPTSILSIRIDDGDKHVVAEVRTDDAVVAQDALVTFQALTGRGSLPSPIEYDARLKSWREVQYLNGQVKPGMIVAPSGRAARRRESKIAHRGFARRGRTRRRR